MSEEQELLEQQPESESSAVDSPTGRSFEMRIGGTTYVVDMHYSKNSPKSFEDKVKELIERDMQKE